MLVEQQCVRVFGEIDLATCEGLRDRLCLIVADSADDLVLDCTELEFMDSSGIGVLVRATRDAQRDGWSFLLAAELSEPVSRLFAISGMPTAAAAAGVAAVLAKPGTA